MKTFSLDELEKMPLDELEKYAYQLYYLYDTAMNISVRREGEKKKEVRDESNRILVW